ncbi:MAG: hypothetical protein HY820_35370 [Acidobacteria bacterium]|nr:hypothetical protein [Acidobacteriota bacterium]
MDIRVTAKEIAEGGTAADLVLATLARGGRKNLKVLLERIYALPEGARNRALAQIALLAGLRRMSEGFKNGNEPYGLRDYFEAARAEGARASLRAVLEARFGALPEWVHERIEQASSDEVNQWTRKSVCVRSLDRLIRPR